MTVEEALALLENLLAPNRLSTIQELVFRQCWEGLTYQQIAETSGYDADYVRVIGSRLWQSLSEVLGERISKSNLRSVLRQHASDPVVPKQCYIDDFPGSPLRLDSPFYIARPPTEEQAYAEILKPGALIRIRAPEKWGKTSLMNRILAQAIDHHYAVVRLNFQQADGEILASLDRLLRWFCINVTQQLQLEPKLDDYWVADLGSKVSCATYLQGHILAQIESPLVIAMDDVQRLFEYPTIAQDFLPLLRVWHEEAKNLTSWARLRLIVVYSTEVYIPLSFHQSPFNVGLPLRLQKFSLAQAQESALLYGFDESEMSNLTRLWLMVNGHPYLLHLAFYRLSLGEFDFEQLLEDAPNQTGIYSDHLRGYLTILQAYPALGAAFRSVILSKEAVELCAIAAYKLESMGLINLSGNQVTASCDLYRRYFCDRLDQFGGMRENLGDFL
ncbi:AAA-like domain-containing protein [Phormidesmis priestleyi]